MKVMQIMSRFCHWDATAAAGSVENAQRLFPGLLFVEAPDHVFEGWGYDSTAYGDDRFIKPVPPDGYLYDDATGTYYRDGAVAPSEHMDIGELTGAVRRFFAALGIEVSK